MSRSFMKFLVTLVVVAGLAVSSYAQDEANMAKPNTKKGDAAWIFEFGGLGTMNLSTFNINNNFGGVSAAGFKCYLADDMALRVLLGFSTASSGSDTVGQIGR